MSADAERVQAARWALWKELAQGQPSRSEREVMLAALRSVAALAARWGAGNAPMRAAAADLMEAVAGTSVVDALRSPPWAGVEHVPLTPRPGPTAHAPDGSEWLVTPEEDQPWRGGGEVPGG